jgi:hypothetical protein
MSSTPSRHPIELDAATRAAAHDAARREGKTLREWLDETIRSKALQKTESKPLEIGNSLEQRLAEITRRLTRNTQAKLSATSRRSEHAPLVWVRPRQTDSNSNSLAVTSKQEDIFHQTLRGLQGQLDLALQTPIENDRDRVQKKQKLTQLLNAVDALQNKLCDTSYPPDSREINLINVDQKRTKTSISPALKQILSKEPSSKKIAKLKEQDLTPILKNLTKKLEAIESRLERIAAPEKYQISAIKDANDQFDSICNQPRAESGTTFAWEKLEIKLTELSEKLNLFSDLKYQAINNDATLNFSILNKEISRLDKKISQYFLDKENNNLAIERVFKEISHKIDRVINYDEILVDQNKDNSFQNEILKGIMDIKTEILQNKKGVTLSEKQHDELIKLLDALNNKLEISQKNKTTEISLENLEKQVDNLAQQITTHRPISTDKNIIDARLNELKEQIITTQTHASQEVKDGFKLIQETLSKLNQNQKAVFNAVHDPSFQSIINKESNVDLISHEKTLLAVTESFETERSASMQKEFIAAARRSANQERSIDLTEPSRPEEISSKSLSLFKVLEERKKSLLLCAGLFGALIAGEPFHENAKLYFKNLKLSVKTSLPSPSANSQIPSAHLTKTLFERKKLDLINLSHDIITPLNRLIDPSPISLVREISSPSSETSATPNKEFIKTHEVIIIDWQFLTHVAIEKDPKPING